MGQFINFSELYNSGGSFAKQEVIVSGSTTTIYGGYAPRYKAVADTDDVPGWVIRKLVVTESGSVQTVVCTWAKGTWTNRASLAYSYFLPAPHNMYSES